MNLGFFFSFCMLDFWCDPHTIGFKCYVNITMPLQKQMLLTNQLAFYALCLCHCNTLDKSFHMCEMQIITLYQKGERHLGILLAVRWQLVRFIYPLLSKGAARCCSFRTTSSHFARLPAKTFKIQQVSVLCHILTQY